MTTISKNAPEQARRFILSFLELQIPMGLGALVCFLLVRLIPASSNFSKIYHPGTYLFASGDILFLAAPVVLWMIFRGYGWHHSVEMGGAMLMPVAGIILFAWLSTSAPAYLLRLITAGYPLMCLGMLAYMLYRRDNFTRWNFLSN
jgi:hypothetical protein